MPSALICPCLVRHSDPKLTMAVYGRAQLHDLGLAVERLPDLTGVVRHESAVTDLAATGTDGPDCVHDTYTALTHESDGEQGRAMASAEQGAASVAPCSERKSLDDKEIDGDGRREREKKGSSPSRTRTY